MAETDSTRSSASGAPDDDETTAGRSGARAAGPEDVPASGVAQRHDLPLRKAGTLPDVPRGEEDPAARPGAENGRADGNEPRTRMLPVTESAPRGNLDAGEGRTADSSAEPFSDSFSGAPERDGSTADALGATDEPHAHGPIGTHAAGGRVHGAHAAAQPETTEGVAGSAGAFGADRSSGTPASRGRPSADDQPPADDQSSADGRLPAGGSHASSVREEPSTDTGALSVRPPDKDAARRAAVRDQAVAAKPALPRFLQVVVALFFPVIVVAAAVRAVATSSFLWLEYHRPGFPADQFGFSLDDRMTYGSYALDYVVNLAPPRYLGGLVTPEGDPLFLESEVAHMADVKGVLGLSFLIALVLFVLAVLACIYLARTYKGGVRRALFAGAVLTLVGIALLTVLAVVAWQTFFTQVHALFFANGTWTFRIDDTLIRLFPEQFWTDSAVTIAVLVLGATLLTLVLTWPTRARRERSMLAQEAAQARYREALNAS